MTEYKELRQSIRDLWVVNVKWTNIGEIETLGNKTKKKKKTYI